MATEAKAISEARLERKPGLYQSVPLDDYLAFDACSNSRLSDLARSPAHALWNIHNPPEPTAALRLGAAIDFSVLQHDIFNQVYIVARQCEAYTEKKARCSRKAIVENEDEKQFCFQHFGGTPSGREVLSLEDWEKCKSIKHAVWAHRAASVLLEKAEACQVTAVWEEPFGLAPLLCKARADGTSNSLHTIIDLKSTVDASPLEFEKDIFRYHYHWQAYLYLRGFNKLSADPAGDDYFTNFVIIAVEKEPPYAVACYRITEEALELAEREVLPLMERYWQCVDSGVWRGYSDEIIAVGLPPWAEKQIERRLI